MIPPPAPFPDDSSPASEERRLGEYRLRQFLGETELSRTWLAEQISVSRSVLVDELRPDRADRRAEFLADIRAKAAVDHPAIASVYEAVAGPDPCFFAHELLPGSSLAERQIAREALPPGRLAHILRRVAEAEIQHEALGQMTEPLQLSDVHQDEHGVIRLKNLAVAGPREPDNSARDIMHFGTALTPLVADGQPGATRLLTLLSWMRGEGLEAPISWGQTRDFCMQIEHQLADPLTIVKPTRQMAGVRKRPRVALAVGTLLALAGIAALAVKMRPPAPAPPPRASLPGPVAIPAGSYRTLDGTKKSQPAFLISSHEVTIGEYAEFLQTLQLLAQSDRERTFDSPDQPAEKSSHLPDGWAGLLAEANAGSKRGGRTVTPDCPVSGIDWWDAAAYAEWKKARLPTQDEWFAALTSATTNPAALQAADWAPVTGFIADRTPNGLLGMAGSVCEWTADRAANPANPLGEKLWVIVGGSYLKPGSNALSREWTADRSLRRPDLGFRVVFDTE